MRRLALSHEFVEEIPSELEEGKVYVSIRFRTAVHLCACGCGNKVVTPIKPAKWRLTFDGDTVSLSPSVGNWQFPCRSHYWIRQNKVEWAARWTKEEIAMGRERDAQALRAYYSDRRDEQLKAERSSAAHKRRGVFSRLWRRFSRSRD
jgi:hypothetical protein